MAYKLLASVFHYWPEGGGRRVRVRRGGTITGLSERRARRLLAAGAIAPIGPSAPATPAVVIPPVVDDQPKPVAAERPRKVAPKPAWVDYAVAKGYDRAKAEALPKRALVEALG